MRLALGCTLYQAENVIDAISDRFQAREAEFQYLKFCLNIIPSINIRRVYAATASFFLAAEGELPCCSLPTTSV